MSKYKVGDKVVLTVTSTNEMGCLPCYVLNDDLILSKQEIDKYAEPLSTYTEPLEAKIRRQAAEITRLLTENERLKPNYENIRAKKEIKAGDIVKIHEGNDNDLCVLCMSTDKKYYNAVDGYGAVYYMLTKEMIAKTGRHMDIDSFLKQIGGE